MLYVNGEENKYANLEPLITLYSQDIKENGDFT